MESTGETADAVKQIAKAVIEISSFFIKHYITSNKYSNLYVKNK